MGTKRVGHARIAALVNKNLNELRFIGNTGLTAGSGINHTDGDGSPVYVSWIEVFGDVVKTSIYVDLDGLMPGGAAADIIGANDAANCHIGQYTVGKMGTLFAAKMICVETPTGGEPDIDVYSSTVGTGTENVAITHADLATEVALLAAAADWTSTTAPKHFTALPAADTYLYLVSSGGGDTAEYETGKFIIELWGKRT